MTPVKFKEANYVDMRMTPPVHEYRDVSIYEHAISCHKLTFLERLQVLFSGRIWAVRMEGLTILSTRKKHVIV